MNPRSDARHTGIAWKGQEIAAITVAAARLRAAPKDQTEELILALLPRCVSDAPLYR